jgi:hypothetical protein
MVKAGKLLVEINESAENLSARVGYGDPTGCTSPQPDSAKHVRHKDVRIFWERENERAGYIRPVTIPPLQPIG